MERYGLQFSKRDVQVLEARIAGGDSLLVRKGDHGTEVRVVKHGDLPMVAVWAPNRKTIFTFLPPDALTPTGRRRWLDATKGKRKRPARGYG